MYFLVIAIICSLGIYCYNQSVLKTTGYECILLSTDDTESSDAEIKQILLEKGEEMAKIRVLGMKELYAEVKITTSKIVLIFYGQQKMWNLPLEITVVYERTYPEKTLRLLIGGIG